MKKTFKYVAVIVIFILSFSCFVSKENLYYQFEQTIQKHHLIIDGEKLQENIFSLTIQDLNILYNHLAFVHIQNAKLDLCGIYNHLELNDTKTSGFAKEFIATQKMQLHLTYWIFDPLHVQIQGNIDTYEVSGKFAIWDKTLTLHLPKEIPIGSMLGRFVKLVDGEYVYEQKF